MSADVTALKRRKWGKSISVAQFRKQKFHVKRLEGLRLQPKVPEKALTPAGISCQEIIYIYWSICH